MLLSYKWLKEFIDLKESAEDVAYALTMAGVEATVVERFEFSNIKAGKIEKVSEFKNASLLTVDVGERKIQVYSNLSPSAWKPEGTVPVAVAPAVVKGTKIEQREIKGVLSEGAVVPSSWLYIGEAEEIIYLPYQPGTDLIDVLQLDDVLIEVEPTPNRGDVLSHYGIARELSAIYEREIRFPEIYKSFGSVKKGTIEIIDEKGCPRYTGVLIDGLKPKRNLLMESRLTRCGIRPIHPFVDVTNYVMLELGQPLHAFDFSRIKGEKILVRRAVKGESLLCLDGVERVLDPDILVIADSERSIALAGIMGGEETGVSERTVSVFLESAHFDPVTIRKGAKKLKISTDASYRFERGVDPELPPVALARACYFYSKMGGEVFNYHDVYPQKGVANRPAIKLRKDRLSMVVGKSYSSGEVERKFKFLGFKIKKIPEGWEITPPTFRFDVSLEEDLIEEVARLLDYQKIPSVLPAYPKVPSLPSKVYQFADRLRDLLCGLGLREVISFSFVSPQLTSYTDDVLRLPSPLSEELSVMRPHLFPALLKTATDNYRKGNRNIAIFEIGKVFFKDYSERLHLGIWLSGNRIEANWSWGTSPWQLFHLKGILEVIFSFTSSEFLPLFKKKKVPFLFEELSSVIVGKKGEEIGFFGAVSPELWEDLAYYAELDLEILVNYWADRRYRPISKFPAIWRDLSAVVDEDVMVQQIVEELKKLNNLESVKIFDIYRNPLLWPGKKSLGIRLIFRAPDRTLTDQEANQIREKAFEILRTKFGAKIRGVDI